MDGILNDEEKNRTEVMKVEVDSSSEKDQVQQPSPISRFLETLRGYEDALDRKLGVEAHSIERKLPDQRNPFYARKSSQLVSVPVSRRRIYLLGSDKRPDVCSRLCLPSGPDAARISAPL